MFTPTPRICPLCGQTFIPQGIRQKYCKNVHYRVCPICGKKYAEPNLDKFKYPPTTCSMECRVAKRTKTSMIRYGITAPGNNPTAREKARETMISKYGVAYAQESKDIRQKSVNTWIEKYGTDNPQKCKEIKAKTTSTNLKKYGSTCYLNSDVGKHQIEQIMLEKYGTVVPLHNPGIKQHQIDTNMQRYGVKYPMMLEANKEKAKQTSLNKYGTIYPQSSEVVKQRIKDTFIRNYGVDNCFKSKEIIDKIHKSFFSKYGVHGVMHVPHIAARIRETNLQKYGVPYYVMLPNVSRASGRLSKINQQMLQALRSAGISCESEHTVENYSYDIYIPQANLLLEVDPTYTHSTVGNHWNPKGIHRYYHLKKTLIAKKHGYRCVHLWDWDCRSKFIASLTNKHCVYPVIPPEIITKTEANAFIQQYGLYDVTKNIDHLVFLGIRYKSKLITLMGFRQIDNLFNVWELVCIENRFEYISYKGYERIIKEFIHLYNPSKIITYADFSKTNGESLELLGFTCIRYIMPSKIWAKGHHAIIDSAEMIPEAMLSDHWLPIYDCGYKLYELSVSPKEKPRTEVQGISQTNGGSLCDG